MPTTSFLDLAPVMALAKSGTLSPVSTSVTRFSTKSGNVSPLDDFALLAMLQGTPIHASPGPCPTCASVCAPTKMQLSANRKAVKDAKTKASEDKKLASTAFKAQNMAKKLECLISSAEAKASKATAKAKELRIKLAHITKICMAVPQAGQGAEPAQAGTFHSHK
jgi:hypothetical protein